MVYDELVKALRGCVLSKPCDGCPYYDPNGPTEKCATMNIAAADAIERLEAALILMVLQYCTDDDGTLWHQFMCAGEGAFDALGITLKTNPQVLWDRLEKLEAKEKS